MFFHLLPGRMDGAVEGAVADVVVALLSSSKTASWPLLILSPLALPRLALPRADRGVSLCINNRFGLRWRGGWA